MGHSRNQYGAVESVDISVQGTIHPIFALFVRQKRIVLSDLCRHQSEDSMILMSGKFRWGKRTLTEEKHSYMDVIYFSVEVDKKGGVHAQ